jgi:hypothetical protein
MKYKIHVSGYLEQTNQLLVSFSSDETNRQAADYQSLAFDVVPYGDVTAQQILDAIAKVAPTICSDIRVAETYEGDDSRAEDLRAFVGQSFEYDENDLLPSGAAQERDAQANTEAEQAEEI